MTTTSDYLVGVLIGEGSFGRVVHGRLKSTEKDVAIKVTDKTSAKKHPRIVQAVLKERRLLEDWETSPYTVTLFAAFHDSQCLYLVLECLTGGSLLHVIRHGLMEDEVAEWLKAIPHYALQLLTALEFIHSKRIIHADLKTENVLVTSNGKVKLGDFGSAVSLDDNSNQLQAVGGTTDYSSPEVIRGGPRLTTAVDLWSLGCIYTAMFTGESPFHAESDALCIDLITTYAVQGSNREQEWPIPAIVPTVWQELIYELLTPDSEERRRVVLGEEGAADPNVRYARLRENSVWKDINLDTSPSYLAPEPTWWREAQTRPLRDGAQGWSAFLM